MSRYFKQFGNGDNEAARGLRERLARRGIGDAAYDKQISHAGDRGFKVFGVVFIVLFCGCGAWRGVAGFMTGSPATG